MWNPFKRFFNTQDPPDDSRPSDSYVQKLLRYIPADIVAAYLTIDDVLRSQLHNPPWLSWGVFTLLLLLTPFYVVFMKSDPPGFAPSKNFHWIASMFAFTVWVFALDGSFAQTFQWFKPYYGSILLVASTLLLPIAERLFVKLVPNSIPGTTPGAPTTGPSTTPGAGKTPPAKK